MRILVLFFALAAASAVSRADFAVQPNDSIMITGDSITEYRTYSVMMEDYLLMCQPTAGQLIAQAGWSGEKADFFAGRMACTVLSYKPTVVTLNDGMNDGCYGAATPAVLDGYRTNETAIVEALKKANVRVVVMGSPKCVDADLFSGGDTNKAKIYNATLAQMADEEKQIAQKEGVLYADVNGTTLAAMQKAKAAFGPKYNFGGGDGIHPGPNGALAMAYAFLKALGATGDIGTVTIDLGLQQAQVSPGQKLISYKDGTATIESSRYPFCFDGDPNAGDTNTANMTRFIPFNQDLNRYLLVVTGLTSDKAKVTWGGATIEFTKDQLKQGVNLAAAFFHNPFFDQFHKVDAAVNAVQGNEIVLEKSFLINLPTIESLAPKSAAGVEQAEQEVISRDRVQYQAAQALVVPIQHTITVTPE